jgi:GNAT superfamily N-acetyltransferase
MIVSANPSDAKLLTEIALKSKAFWGYSHKQIEHWREDLTITLKMFEEWNIYKYLVHNEIVGFYILNRANIRTSFLEFLFVAPDFINQQIGTKLLNHAKVYCIEGGSAILNVLSDPNAESFYAKNGFKVIGRRDSSIPNRFLLEMEFEILENM